jgi:hypothetical protein
VGGLGIGVYDAWRDFWSFAHWIENNLGPVPWPGAVLDRIDNKKDFEPGNMRWCNMKENCQNKINSHLITIDGVTQSLSTWCQIQKVSKDTVRQRVYKLGWTWPQALGFEVQPRKRRGPKKVDRTAGTVYN